MAVDTKTKSLVINKLTQTKYNSIERKENELYDIIDSLSLNNYITNCITNISHKLMIGTEDNVLSLDVGSIIYYPDNSTINIDSKKSLTISETNITGFVFVNKEDNSLFYTTSDKIYVSDIQPTTEILDNSIWFDTENKIIKKYTSSQWQGSYSFPICEFTIINSNITISNIFNGFGYLGNCLFILPGVEGLIPNGKNEKGYLINTTFKTNDVSFNIVSESGSLIISDIFIGVKSIKYNNNLNFNLDSNNEILSYCKVGEVSLLENSIIAFKKNNVLNISTLDSLPSQTGKDGKFLQTDGINAEWQDLPINLVTSENYENAKTWKGTITEYEALESYDDNITYIITDDYNENIVITTDMIEDSAITNSKIANNTVSEEKLTTELQDKINKTPSGLDIGDIIYTTRTDNELAGKVECNGAQYNFADVNGGDNTVQELLDNGKLPYLPIAEFDTIVAEQGGCDSFGYDSGATYFKVPKKLGRVLVRSQKPTADNNYTWYNIYSDGWCEQGGVLPEIATATNITISFPIEMSNNNYVALSGLAIGSELQIVATNISIWDRTTTTASIRQQGNGVKSWQISGYANSAEYTPDKWDYQNVKVLRPMVQLFNGATDEALATCTSVLADVAGLKQTTDGMIDYVVETQEPTSANGYTWYRLYKSGWVEQGGIFFFKENKSAVLTLPKPMIDNRYIVVGIYFYTSGLAGYCCERDYDNRTTTSFKMRIVDSTGTGVDGWVEWVVFGQAA